MSLRAHVRLRRGPFEIDARVDAEAGQTIGLIGPNGAGKSTIVAALAGLLDPQESTISLGGQTLDEPGHNLSPAQRSVGVLFQDLRLFPHMSALDNVAFALRATGANKAEAKREARALLEQLGADTRTDVLAANLSGGEAQRVALARTLARRPRLLLLDEPLSALDVTARREIRSLLGEILVEFDGVAIIVGHDPVDVLTVAGEVIVLEQGRVSQRGTAEEIRRRPLSAYASEFVGVNMFRGRLEPLEPGVARLRTPEGDLVVALDEPLPTDTEVIATLRPSDVSVHVERPAGSARNVLQGRIQSIVRGERARVHVDTSPPIVAELTLGSLDALGLEENRTVHVSFKATEVSLVLA